MPAPFEPAGRGRPAVRAWCGGHEGRGRGDRGRRRAAGRGGAAGRAGARAGRRRGGREPRQRGGDRRAARGLGVRARRVPDRGADRPGAGRSLRGFAVVRGRPSPVGRRTARSPQLGDQRGHAPGPSAARGRATDAALAGAGASTRSTVANGGGRHSWCPTGPSAWSSCARARRGAPTPRSARSGGAAAPERHDRGRRYRTSAARDGWQLDASGRRPTSPSAARRGAGHRATFDAPYWMEAPLWQAVVPAVVCGPSGGGLHAVDEWVDLRRCGVRDRAGRRPPGCAADRGRLTRAGCAATRRCSTPGCASTRRRPTPFTIPGHKQRTDLVGDVVAGDVPLYAGLDTMKLTRRRARRRRGAGGAAVGRRRLPVLDRRGRPTPTRRSRSRSAGTATASWSAAPCTARCCSGWCWPACTPVWVRPEVDPATGLPLGVAPGRRAPRARRAPGRAGRASSATRRTSAPSATSPASRTRRTTHDVPAGRRRRLGGALRLPPRPAARTRSQLGADVMVTSAHKTLPAWSQAALVLARTERVDAGAPRRRRRGHRDHQPGGRDPGQHRRRPRPARARRRGAARRRDRRDRGRRATGCAPVDGLVVLDGPAVDPLKLDARAGRHRRRRQRRRAGPARGRAPGRVGRPRRPRRRRLAGRHRRDPRRARRRARRVGRAAPRRSRGRSSAPASYGVEPVTAVSPREAFFAAAETVPARRRRRPGQRRARRAVPARHPGARARRADHRRDASRPSSRRARPASGSRTPPTRPAHPESHGGVAPAAHPPAV